MKHFSFITLCPFQCCNKLQISHVLYNVHSQLNVRNKVSALEMREAPIKDFNIVIFFDIAELDQYDIIQKVRFTELTTCVQ